MQEAKILFSPHELGLMTDSSWILTKNAVIAKFYEGMGQLSRSMEIRVQEVAALLPVPLAFSSAKISRGENYQGLPYVMLDYPRVFGREAVLAIRTFFWWGRYCSITLHANGAFLEAIAKAVTEQAAELEKQGFVCATAGDEWNHDLNREQYTPPRHCLPQLESREALSFLKVAGRIELQQWPLMEEALYGRFLLLLELCLNGRA